MGEREQAARFPGHTVGRRDACTARAGRFARGMECRPGCAACCIAPSISSPLPKMPAGKPAGVPCLHLLPDLRCELFGRPERPAVCSSLRPGLEMCGATREHALTYLGQLEMATRD